MLLNQRAAAVVVLALSACATAPAPKLGWAESGLGSDESEESQAEPQVSDAELEARAKLGPLAVSTYRFAAVERVLRSRFGDKPMPEDAIRAWSGIFAAIDQALAHAFPVSRNELLGARVAADAELEQDRRAYAALPDGLPAAVGARVHALSAQLRVGKLPSAKPEDALFAWPVHPAVVTSLFGPRLDPLEPGTWKRHQGVDIAAEKGELVTAAARGVVAEAGPRAGYGLLVAIRHADGTITRYGHLSQLLTRQGLAIERGGAVGLAGATGRATGPHVHFEVWRDGRAVDPLEELEDPDEGLASAERR